MNTIQSSFGDIDIYLFDQLLKGRFDDCKRIVDIGCGDGRNLVYFLQNGFEVYGIDPNPVAIDTVKTMAQQLSLTANPNNFIVGTAEDMPFEAASFRLVICSAVLHFANDKAHFEQMLHGMWRVLKPGGYFFARLASDIGIEGLVQSLGDGKYLLPDGSVRYLVTHDALVQYTKELNGELFEPIKTTNVSNLRGMTTWCVRKR